MPGYFRALPHIIMLLHTAAKPLHVDMDSLLTESQAIFRRALSSAVRSRPSSEEELLQLIEVSKNEECGPFCRELLSILNGCILSIPSKTKHWHSAREKALTGFPKLRVSTLPGIH